jgi:uncharacterized protein (DUF952 family)
MVSIYHIAEPDRWDPSLSEYAAASLASEGFIHCSTTDQLPKVASELYAGRSDLVLLTINTAGIEGALVWEDLYELNQEYPHIYGPIPMSAITMAEPLSNALPR